MFNTLLVQHTKSSKNHIEDRGLNLRQSYLLYPGEAPEVDYKAAAPFVSRGDKFSLSLIKHILGMANAGGGFIVLGYPEDSASKRPEPGMVADEILKTYDISTIAASVESYTFGTGKVDIIVHKDRHPRTDQLYPIIEVRGLKTRPFFCKSSAMGVLEENALYIRISGARTVKVASPDEWDQLIDICVSRRQDETLKRFTDLMAEFGLKTSATSSDLKKEVSLVDLDWIESVRADAMKEAEERNYKFEGMELIHLLNIEKTWSNASLFQAMESSMIRNTGWPIGLVNYAPNLKPEPFKDGIRCVIKSNFKDSFDYWYLDKGGNFYFFRVFQEISREETDRQFWFDSNIWRITEALEHIIALYRALEVDPTNKIYIELNFIGIQERVIHASPGSARHLFPRKSGRAEKFIWNKTISLDGLTATLEQDVIAISNGLFGMFDFLEIKPEIIQEIITQYRGSKT